MKNHGDLGSWTRCILHYVTAGNLCGLGSKYGGLNKNGLIDTHIPILSHQGVTLFEWTIRIRTHCLVGLSVATLEKVFHWGWVLVFEKPMPDPASLLATGCKTLR